MRHRDVNHVNIGPRQHFAVIRGQQLHGRHLAEPFEQRGLQVAHGRELGADGESIEGEPAAEGAGDFAAHQAAAYDSHADGFHLSTISFPRSCDW